MSIVSEIERIKSNITRAYTACESKGATLPSIQNSSNLVECISSITGGGEATGYTPHGLIANYSAYGCEGGTTWLDSSGNGHDMTMHNNPVFDAENLLWNLDGVNQYGDSNFTAPAYDFTIEMYGIIPDVSNNSALITMFGLNYNYYAGYGMAITIAPTSKRMTSFIATSTNSSQLLSINPSSILEAGMKLKTIIRRHASDGKLSITLINANGREDNNNTLTTQAIKPNTQKFSIGAISLRSDIANTFDKGSYHAVRLYERCLTDEEIAQNHAEDVRIYGE